MKNEETMDPVSARACLYIEKLFRDFADGHDASHSIRVWRNAVRIASHCEGCDMTVVSLAALLHDADDHKLFRTENNANARRFLAEEGILADTADRICAAINGVSFSRNKGKRPDTLESMIVQDADRLDAMGAVGIARTFAYGGAHGRSTEDSIRHFHEKLLLLRDMMNTEAAKEIAGKRHALMETFLEELKREMADSDDPG